MKIRVIAVPIMVTSLLFAAVPVSQANSQSVSIAQLAEFGSIMTEDQLREAEGREITMTLLGAGSLLGAGISTGAYLMNTDRDDWNLNDAGQQALRGGVTGFFSVVGGASGAAIAGPTHAAMGALIGGAAGTLGGEVALYGYHNTVQMAQNYPDSIYGRGSTASSSSYALYDSYGYSSHGGSSYSYIDYSLSSPKTARVI